MSKKYKMPAKQDLKSRSSTISNAFAIAITPFIRPNESELEGYYEALGIEEGKCAYCLGDGNGRDHLKPLVKDGMPTGYITDINNLVPCCQKCNSSKGSKSFEEWYMSPDNVKRLKNDGRLTDDSIGERYNRIKEFESKIGLPLDYEKLVGTDLWNQYKKRREQLLQSLEDNQKFCNQLNEIILEKIK